MILAHPRLPSDLCPHADSRTMESMQPTQNDPIIDLVTPTLILASQSPRRQEFLRALGLNFQVRTADLDESRLADESPAEMVERLAQAKAHAIAARLPADAGPALILAADTTVALGDIELGKPVSADDAVNMLTILRSRPHQVHTAIHLLATANGREVGRLNTTTVHMRPYTDREMAAYIATGDATDKAGAYAIQHREFAPVERLIGCASGVMGMPLADLQELLADFGVTLNIDLAPICARLTGAPCCQGE